MKQIGITDRDWECVVVGIVLVLLLMMLQYAIQWNQQTEFVRAYLWTKNRKQNTKTYTNMKERERTMQKTDFRFNSISSSKRESDVAINKRILWFSFNFFLGRIRYLLLQIRAFSAYHILSYFILCVARSDVVICCLFFGVRKLILILAWNHMNRLSAHVIVKWSVISDSFVQLKIA